MDAASYDGHHICFISFQDNFEFTCNLKQNKIVIWRGGCSLSKLFMQILSEGDRFPGFRMTIFVFVA